MSTVFFAWVWESVLQWKDMVRLFSGMGEVQGKKHFREPSFRGTRVVDMKIGCNEDLVEFGLIGSAGGQGGRLVADRRHRIIRPVQLEDFCQIVPIRRQFHRHIHQFRVILKEIGEAAMEKLEALIGWRFCVNKKRRKRIRTIRMKNVQGLFFRFRISANNQIPYSRLKPPASIIDLKKKNIPPDSANQSINQLLK